jgi:hypothetical protein
MDCHEDSQEKEFCSAEDQLLFVHKVEHILALPTLRLNASSAKTYSAKQAIPYHNHHTFRYTLRDNPVKFLKF